MKNDVMEMFLSKGVSTLLMVVSFNTLAKLNVEMGVIASIGQLLWIMLMYMANIKKGRKTSYPPLYYVVSSMVAFILGVFMAEPVHGFLQNFSWLNINKLPVMFWAFLFGIMAEYTYELVEGIKKQISSLLPELRKYIANKINPDSDAKL